MRNHANRMKSILILPFICLFLILFGGCGDSAKSSNINGSLNQGDGNTAQDSAEGRDGLEKAETATAENELVLSGIVYYQAQIGATYPLKEAEVCLQDKHCVKTDRDGKYYLKQISTGSKVVILYKKEGFHTAIRHIHTTVFDLQLGNLVLPGIEFDQIKDVINQELDKKKGHLIIEVSSHDKKGSVKGALLTVSPESGKGPYHLNENNQLELSTNGVLNDSHSGFITYLNMDTGKVKLSMTHDTWKCEPEAGWRLDEKDFSKVEIQIKADHFSYEHFICFPKK